MRLCLALPGGVPLHVGVAKNGVVQVDCNETCRLLEKALGIVMRGAETIGLDG